MHPLIVATGIFSIHAIIGKHFGLESLGLYASVTIVETTFVMVLMSSMKTYFFPAMGKIKNDKEKKIFANNVIYLLQVITLPIVITVIVMSEYVLLILFSNEFLAASWLLAIQITSMLSSAFCWPYANYLLSDGKYKIYFAIDILWVSLLIILIFYISNSGQPLWLIPLVYVSGSFASFFMYTVTMYKLYGSDSISKYNLIFLAVSLLITLSFYFIVFNFSFMVQSLLIAVFFILYALYLNKNLNRFKVEKGRAYT